MSKSKPIVLYDFPGNASPDKAWNVNTWKSRFTLNIREVPYKTEWVEYPDVKPVTQAVGAKPNGKRFLDGSDLYTLPAILDPNTNICVVDSEKIVAYVQEKYPNASVPDLLLAGTLEKQLEIRNIWSQFVLAPIMGPLMGPVSLQLNPRSQAHYIPPREAMFGEKLTEIAPEGTEKHAAAMKEIVQGLSVVSRWVDQHSKGPFVLGRQPTFADCIFAATLIWTKIITGEREESTWGIIAKAEGGRWKRYLELFDKWTTVH